MDIRCMMRDAASMRTTLNIDDDVLSGCAGAGRTARRARGAVVSDLARSALTSQADRIEMRNGVPLLTRNADARPVSLAVVNALRDDEP